MNFFNTLGDCPIGNGAGTCKTIEDVEKLLKTDIPVIEIGSITMESREGNTGNTFHDGGYFTLNSLGLPNPGFKYYEHELAPMIILIHRANKKAIVNVVGFSVEENAELTRMAFDSGADIVVINCGCPNVWVDGKQKGILTYDLDAMKKTMLFVLFKNQTEAKQGRIGIKLSPITDPLYLANVATFLNNLADAPIQKMSIGYIGFITTQNTIPNCYSENNIGEQFISPAGGLAGMAGKSIFPMALGQIKQFRKLLNPNIKIIGVGGVESGSDVQKMLRNGASLVQIASRYYASEDPGIFNHIGSEYLTGRLEEK